MEIHVSNPLEERTVMKKNLNERIKNDGKMN